MENIITEHVESADSAIRGSVLVRMAWLTNGKALGAGSVRAGEEKKPVVGYTIRRDDAGLWIFENLLEGDADKYVGKKLSIAY